MKYKAHVRVPTEMYAYIEPIVEGTPEEIVEAYYEFKRLVEPNEGLPFKEFNKHLDHYLATGEFDPEVYAYQLSQKQKLVISEIRKAFARIKKK